MIERIKAAMGRARLRRPLLDHAVRAWERFGKDRGNQLAAAITLPGFLSFFPLIALTMSVAGFIAHYNSGAEADITRALEDFFPGLIGTGRGQINVADIADQRAATGTVGLVGLLLGGLGWVDAMRTTLRQLWHQEPLRRNVIVAKVLDAVVLVGIGLAVAASLVVTSVATAAAGLVIDHTALTGGSVTELLLRILAIVLALAGDFLLYAFLFLRLSQPGGSRRDILGGAVFGAIGFEILKSVGAIYIAHTTHNPLYASFAVVIGLLVWTNLVARLFLFAAAWAVTAPYDSDVSPSGTAGSLRVDAVPVPVATDVHPPGWALARIAGTVSAAAIGTVAVLTVRRSVRQLLDAVR
ncbi:MAG TPA: YihY/virulence factor BrkB family protein, partial [Solirubrobacteraceae bacterium]|nr:YihY/virulence factor BrkB family protein [Solirubrobacteraceae bacterium]